MADRLLSMRNVLSIRDLRKAYGDKIAVDRISFEVSRSEIVGLLGPNGAGKTTTISMILGVLQPDSGSIQVEGADLATGRAQGAGAHEFRRRLCSAAGESDGAAESPCLRPALRGEGSVGADQRSDSPVRSGKVSECEVRGAVLGRADAGRAGEGHAQPTAFASVG